MIENLVAMSLMYCEMLGLSRKDVFGRDGVPAAPALPGGVEGGVAAEPRGASWRLTRLLISWRVRETTPDRGNAR